jgi:hypothetical protein
MRNELHQTQTSARALDSGIPPAAFRPPTSAPFFILPSAFCIGMRTYSKLCGGGVSGSEFRPPTSDLRLPLSGLIRPYPGKNILRQFPLRPLCLVARIRCKNEKSPNEPIL